MDDDGFTSTPFNHRCAGCGVMLEVISGAGEPYAGAVTMCAYCHMFLVVTEGGTRMLTDGEWLKLPPGHRTILTALRDKMKEINRTARGPGDSGA